MFVSYSYEQARGLLLVKDAVLMVSKLATPAVRLGFPTDLPAGSASAELVLSAPGDFKSSLLKSEA